MQDLEKKEVESCPHCGKTIKTVVSSWKFPPELIAIANELGININKFKH